MLHVIVARVMTLSQDKGPAQYPNCSCSYVCLQHILDADVSLVACAGAGGVV